MRKAKTSRNVGVGEERKYVWAQRDLQRLDEDKFRYDIETTPFHVSFVFDDEDDISWA